LKETGRYDRGWLGIALAEVPEELFVGENHRQRGALVTSLAGKNTPAAAAGLLAGDIIESVDQQPIADMGHLMRLVGDMPTGKTIQVDVRRDSQPLTIAVVIGARPNLDGE
jgi:serine protease Do